MRPQCWTVSGYGKAERFLTHAFLLSLQLCVYKANNTSTTSSGLCAGICGSGELQFLPESGSGGCTCKLDCSDFPDSPLQCCPRYDIDCAPPPVVCPRVPETHTINASVWTSVKPGGYPGGGTIFIYAGDSVTWEWTGMHTVESRISIGNSSTDPNSPIGSDALNLTQSSKTVVPIMSIY